MQVRLRALSEAECYARCYGSRDEAVTVIARRRPELEARLSGEALRRLFEERLDTRDPELAEDEAA